MSSTVVLRMLAVSVAVAVTVPWVSGASVAVANTNPMVPSWLSCLQSDSMSSCLQDRVMSALDDLLPRSDDKLPDGVSPEVAKVIDRIGEMVASQWYPDTDNEEDSSSAKAVDSMDEVRGHKKKKHKAMKKLIIKLLILLYVKQQAVRLFLYAAQTFILFKFMVFAGIYVLTNVVKTFTLVKWHHHEKHAPKVLYIEPQIKHVTQHHAHVAPPESHEHEDYVPEGVDYEPSPDHEPLWARSEGDAAQRLAYFKQLPPRAHLRMPNQ